MNVLLDSLPSTVDISGKKYPINTDFRAGVKFELLMQNNEENILKLLEPYFPDGIPEDALKTKEGIIATMKAIELFFCCGSLPEKKEKKEEKNIAYSFDVDGEAILSDFWHYYNIDLTNEGLHWWTFRALLYGLPDKSEFKQRIYYRTCNLKELSKGERKRIQKIRSVIEIKDRKTKSLTLEERNAGWLEYISKRRKETSEGGVENG